MPGVPEVGRRSPRQQDPPCRLESRSGLIEGLGDAVEMILRPVRVAMEATGPLPFRHALRDSVALRDPADMDAVVEDAPRFTVGVQEAAAQLGHAGLCAGELEKRGRARRRYRNNENDGVNPGHPAGHSFYTSLNNRSVNCTIGFRFCRFLCHGAILTRRKGAVTGGSFGPSRR
jgi:hypothetical protein